MKNFYLFIVLVIFINKTSSQEKYSLGVSLGFGKNYYKNQYMIDSNHFKFNDPTSINFGAQIIRHLNTKNHIVGQFGYTSKKIQFEYNTNEPKIPYTVNDNTIIKYDVISLSFGFRRSINIKSIKSFVQIDFVADYNLNVANGNTGSGNSINNSDIPISGEIIYTNIGNSNIGEKSYTFGNNFSIGFNLGKKKQYEISGNINIPFNKIQKNTASYNYQWHYDDKEYNHNLNYKGRIIYPNIKFTMYVFK